MKREFYGIDLGTTYSCIATFGSDDLVRVIPNKKGHMITPSAVYFDENNKMLVGQAAKAHLADKPDNTVVFIKREMSNQNYTVTINGQTYDPIQISSFILKHLVDFANEKRKNEEGKDPIYDVVITVPAYFGNLENTRTKEAGKMAGLNVLQLIEEPTAAALSYGQKQQSDKTLLVYDLGGGTFDVSILEFKSGLGKVVVTRGDHHLGGVDWDKALAQLALSKIGYSFDSLETKDQNKLLMVAEGCKQDLSEEESATMSFTYKGIHNVEITRQEFEAETQNLMTRTTLLVDEALDVKGLSINDIDEVILVGGSTRMPMVAQMLKKNYNVDAKIVDPDMAVAKGAALTAVQITEPERGCDGIVMVGRKGSRGYGLSVIHEDLGRALCRNLIFRDDNLEIRRSATFGTNSNGQTGVNFEFFENESNEEWNEICENEKIQGREDRIEWGKPVPKETPVEVTFERDASGCVRIFAECSGAKGEFEIVIGSTDNVKSK